MIDSCRDPAEQGAKRRGEPLELLRPARPIVHDDDPPRLIGKGTTHEHMWL